MEITHQAALREQTSTDKTWTLAAALGRFIQQHQRLPISGMLGDMASSSVLYLSLQQCYADQAAEDRAALCATTPGLDPDDPDVAVFCKNASALRLCPARTLDAPRDPVATRLSCFALAIRCCAFMPRPCAGRSGKYGRVPDRPRCVQCLL